MPLLNQLNTLETSGLVRLAAVRPELEYLFRHALVQHAAYGFVAQSRSETIAPECPSPPSGADDEQKRGVSAARPFRDCTRRRTIQASLAGSREGRARIGVIPKPVPECGLRSPY